MAADASGGLYVVGTTNSSNFPTYHPFQASLGAGWGNDAFVARLSPQLKPDQQRCGCQVATVDMPQYHSLYPVNTRTGNFWTRATDLVVAGTAAAPAIPFGRTYASQSIDETIGALGYGWQHVYATRVITPGVPAVRLALIIILSPENNRLRYSSLGGGQYAAWPGVYSTLVSGNGVYTQTLRSQAQYVFNAATGRLQALLRCARPRAGAELQRQQAADGDRRRAERQPGADADLRSGRPYSDGQLMGCARSSTATTPTTTWSASRMCWIAAPAMAIVRHPHRRIC